MIKFYKILTFILQPVAYMVLMMSVSTLMLGLANPQLLLGGAVGLCVFIYLFCSFRFTLKAVVANQPVKRHLKDWIKVNSYIGFLQALLMLFSVVMVLFVIPKSTFDTTFKTAYDMMVQQQEEYRRMGSYERFSSYMRIMIGCLGIFEAILLVHIITGWRMLKGYSHYFVE